MNKQVHGKHHGIAMLRLLAFALLSLGPTGLLPDECAYYAEDGRVIIFQGVPRLGVYTDGEPVWCDIRASLAANEWPVACANGQQMPLSVFVSPEWEDRAHVMLGDTMFRRSCV